MTVWYSCRLQHPLLITAWYWCLLQHPLVITVWYSCRSQTPTRNYHEILISPSNTHPWLPRDTRILYCRSCIRIESVVCLSTVYGNCTADVIFVLSRVFDCPQYMALVLPTLYSYWVGCLSVHSVWHLYCRRCIRIESVVCLSTVYGTCIADVVFVLSRLFVFAQCMAVVLPTLYSYWVGCLSVHSVWHLYCRRCILIESGVCLSTVYGTCTADVVFVLSRLFVCPQCMALVLPTLYSYWVGCLSINSVWQLYHRRCNRI